jgi:uncharacterized protein YdhG (YjbR/CyaY superfamily)
MPKPAPKSKAKPKPKTFQEYMDGLSPISRSTLKKVCAAIKAAAPAAEECISYGLASFRLNGRPLVAVGAAAEHCAFYPMSGRTVAEFRDELADYETSKGTIRFAAEKPLPAVLVRKLVKARIKENDIRTGKSKRGKSG